MDVMARAATSIEDRQLWMIGAAGCRSFAAFDSAVAAASFIIGWMTLIMRIKGVTRGLY